MRSLQLILCSQCSAWGFVNESVVVEWSQSNQEYLLWWSDASNPLLGVSPRGDSPNLLFWSDVSDQGWGAHLQDYFISALWFPVERSLCSDRILTCRIKSIRSPAKVGLVVTDLITSPVVSWEGWKTPPHPPPAPRLCCHSLLNHRRGKTSLLLW